MGFYGNDDFIFAWDLGVIFCRHTKFGDWPVFGKTFLVLKVSWKNVLVVFEGFFFLLKAGMCDNLKKCIDFLFLMCFDG